MTSGNVVAPKRSAKSNRLDNCYLYIFTPQMYQVTLVDAAHKHNTIACLGTSSSKTFIAVMVIKELAYKVRHCKGKEGVKTFFFVESESTAVQYARVIGLHTDLVAAVCMNWSESDWFSALRDHHVILTTTSAFLGAVRAQLISVTNVNLLVFDDCHLAACLGHAYTEIVDILYSQCDTNVKPLILGLTSSILDNIFTPDELNLRLANLENSFHSRIQMTPDAVMADPYSSRPREFTCECDQYVDTTGLVAKLSDMLRSSLDFINDMMLVVVSDDGDETSCEDLKTTAKLVLVETERVLLQLGPWCAARVAAAFVLQLMKIDKPSDDLRQILHSLASTTLRSVEKTVDTLFDIRVQTLEDFNLFVNPKAIKLIDVLRECKPDDNFVIMSGDFDGDFESDGDCGDSVDSIDEDDDASDDGANAQKSAGKSFQKIAAGGMEKNSGTSGQHYIAVRRSACNGNPDAAAAPEQTSDNDGICGVVFVSHRHVAFALNKLIVELCNWDPDLYFLRSHYIAGYIPSGTPMTDAQRQKQENVLRKFRQREYNVLVAATALEEGVDLPRCNLVVRFDQPTSYRSYMLSKGRARASNAKYCVLVYKDAAEEFNRDLALYRGIEKILLERCRNKDDFSSEPVDETFANSLVPPYHPVNEDSTFRVSMQSAIRIINRYCAKLPSDAFTHLTPRCRIEEVSDDDSNQVMYRAILKLPINSLIKRPIVGDYMPGKRLAQMAVALKACSELHDAKELDDHLQPVGRELIRYEDEDCEWEDHELHGQARPGSTKRKQYYCKKMATPFLHRPQSDQLCCLYAFCMTLTCPITEEQNTRGRPIHAPEDTSRGFGFLCAQQMPSVPAFPVFTRSGEVTVDVKLISSDICLTSEQLNRLYKFHHFVFCHVLRLEKSPMVFDPERALCGCVVVPINVCNADNNCIGRVGNLAIDWNFIQLIEESPLAACIRRGFKASHRTNANSSVNGKAPKEPFVFEEEKFADAVVMPSYRNIDQPQYFYVAEIRLDLNPRSSFPSPELYDTFEHYYKSKYNLTLTSHKQPLLDVDHTSARLNLLTPRYVNQKGVALLTSSATTRRAKRESLQQKQILVPELCDVHPFPASLWRKAVCVPAMLYRTNCLLIAEELRSRIAKEAGICSSSKSNKFRPLKFDYSDSAAVFAGQIESENNCDALDKNSRPFNNDEQISNNFLASMSGNIIAGCENTALRHSITSPQSHKNTDFVHVCSSPTPSVTVSQPTNCEIASENTLNGDDFISPETTENKAADDVIKIFNSSCSVTDSAMGHHSPLMKGSKETCMSRGNSDCMLSNGNHVNSLSCDLGRSNTIAPAVSAHWGNEGNSRFSVFSLDADLTSEGGPSPCDIIQTLTMSNANDFFNLERLETIGDSFLKFAVTIYLYCTYTGIHEGKLSYMRSLQVSNYNLYRLGKRKNLPECMIAVKFEPSENWLPPGYTFKHIDSNSKISILSKTANDSLSKCSDDETSLDSSINVRSVSSIDSDSLTSAEQIRFNQELEEVSRAEEDELAEAGKESTESGSIGASYHLSATPYCLQTQHSLPDKSIADCVEALIGCYLASCGRRSALLFMDWLGLRVLPAIEMSASTTTGITSDFGCLPVPISPLLLSNVSNATEVLNFQLDGFDEFEKQLNYRFNDRSYLLQAFTHASYHYNNITDCYQRLEFLGDAILDYVITRHLFEDSTKHSPGVLTDLRSALVNNNMFACLAVRWNFHKYFKAISPQLFSVIEKFVLWQMEHDYQVILDEEMGGTEENEDEDIEIPKALGDIFESVAGAIYLDSGMSLDAVWTVYHRMMKPHIDVFLEKIPKSPVRELLEMEPETAKFEKPERTVDGKIRVCVNVVGKGTFTGVGRNYRIAKSAAAKRALKVIKMLATKSDVQQAAFSDFPLIIRQ